MGAPRKCFKAVNKVFGENVEIIGVIKIPCGGGFGPKEGGAPWERLNCLKVGKAFIFCLGRESF